MNDTILTVLNGTTMSSDPITLYTCTNRVSKVEINYLNNIVSLQVGDYLVKPLTDTTLNSPSRSSTDIATGNVALLALDNPNIQNSGAPIADYIYPRYLYLRTGESIVISGGTPGQYQLIVYSLR